MIAALALAACPQDLPLADLDRAFPRFAQTVDVAFGELDTAPGLDAVVATLAGCWVVRQTSSGSFAVDPAPLPETDLPLDDGRIELFDANGDGDLDLYVGRWGAHRLFLGDGDGGFTDASGLLPPTALLIPEAVDSGDVDGDGDVDLCMRLGSGFELWRNGGPAGFTIEFTLGPPAGDLRLLDVDGDGDLDRVSVEPGSCDGYFGCFAGLVQLALNDGSGIFTSAPFPSTPVFGRQIAAGDLEPDGQLDLVVASTESAPTKVFRGLGGATFVEAVDLLPSVPDLCEGAALFDLELDGDLDLFLTGNDFFGDPVDVLLRRVPGGYEDATGDLPQGACCVAGQAFALDLDQDGDDDLAIAGETPRVLLRIAASSLEDATPRQAAEKTGSPTTADVVLGDLDGDGVADGACASGFALNVLHNDGTGELTPTQLATFSPVQDWSLALGDIEGDGDLDLLSIISTAPATLWLNDGAAAFTRTAFSLPPSVPYGAVFLDADADGDQDVAVYGNNNQLLINDGTGALTATPGFPTSGTSEAAAFGDFDLDGDLDGVYQPIPGSGYLTRNDGASWTLVPGIGDLFGSRDLDAGDLDGDGALDLLATGFFPGDRVLLGDGAGGFALSAYLPGDHDSFEGALADLDEDGDLDAVTGRFWENTGSGLVEATPPGVTKERSDVPLALGDLDGDGDLDVLYDGELQLENTLRATGWRSLAGVGRPLALELRGPAGEAWLLAWSLATAELALPPFGTLKLDPAGAFVAAAGSLASGGEATPVLPVPPVPGLVGVDVYWQSLVGDAPRFTNRTTTTLLEL
ncbi:MAG: VCBS repeat-containing protein [Planctomycetota bacterium]